MHHHMLFGRVSRKNQEKKMLSQKNNLQHIQFPFSRSRSTYVGTDRRIGDHFGRPIYFECKKTSQCTLACNNCNSCSALQREYLMSSRCVAYLLFASEPNTCAVPACVFLCSLEVVEDELLVWEGASVCLVWVWRTDSVGRDFKRESKNSCSHSSWSECSQQACTFILLCCRGHFPVRFSTSREQIPKRAHTVWPGVFFKMSFRPCATGCGRYLAPGDGHDYCLTCLGLAHAEVALMDGTCSHCGNMTISVLRSRLQYLEETVAYINRQGGLRSRRMWQLARHLLLWSQKHLRSLRAIHIPGVLNRTADKLSWQPALPGEWRLNPQVVQLIWGLFGAAQVDLFASPHSTHCQLFYSLTEGTLGTDALAHSWPQGLRKYAFPPVSLLAQTLCKAREDEEQVLLVAPYWPSQTWFSELMLLATAPPWPIPLRKDLLSQRWGTLWHPRPDLWKLHVWSLDGTRRF